MGSGEKNSSSFFPTRKLLDKRKTSIRTEKQPKSHFNIDKLIGYTRSNVNKSIPVGSKDEERDEEWETIRTKTSNRIERSKRNVPYHQSILLNFNHLFIKMHIVKEFILIFY